MNINKPLAYLSLLAMSYGCMSNMHVKSKEFHKTINGVDCRVIARSIDGCFDENIFPYSDTNSQLHIKDIDYDSIPEIYDFNGKGMDFLKNQSLEFYENLEKSSLDSLK